MNPSTKNKTPKDIAMAEINLMKRSSSMARGVSEVSAD
jgi:hypothetical protein